MISKSAFKVIAFSAALSLQGVSAYADVLEDVAKAALENTLKEGVAKVKEAGSKVVSANIIENINIKKAELDRGLAQARAKSAEMGKEKAAELNALGKRVEGALAENVSRFNEAARKTPAEIKKPMSDIGNSVANRLKKMGAAMKSAPGKVANKIKKPMSDIGNSAANRLKKVGAAMKSAPGKVANKINKWGASMVK